MLTRKTVFGVGWSVLSRLSGRLVDFATVLVLARVLTPADFGLIALAATVVTVLDTVFELPLMQALVRLQAIERAHLDTAFTLGAARGLLLAALVAAVSVPFSWLYSDARLAGIVLLLAAAPLLRSLYSPAMSEHYRTLRFRKFFAIDLSGKVCGTLASVAAVLCGGGYWAIATNTVASSAAAVLLSYCVAPYRPRLSVAKWADFSGFIGWFSAGQVLSALNWQLDRVLLGRFLTRTTFGQYTMSADISVLPTQSIIGPGMQPVMAAFSRIGHDIPRLRAAFLKAARFTMMLALPACLGISLCADLVVAMLFGPGWEESAVFLRWLALPVGLTAYFQAVYALAVAVNRFNLVVRLNLVDLAIRALLLALGFAAWGIPGVLVARALTAAIMFVLSMRTAGRVLKLTVVEQLGNIRPVAAACVAMAASVAGARHWAGLVHLGHPAEAAAAVCAGAVAYGAVLHLLGVRLGSLVAFPAQASWAK